MEDIVDIEENEEELSMARMDSVEYQSLAEEISREFTPEAQEERKRQTHTSENV
jgi:hypothetical protein